MSCPDALTRAQAAVDQAAARVAGDPWRPTVHLLPPAGWINDPNGTVYHDGWYHVFYQHNPYSDRWATMHWGHFRSRDLVRWEHCPIALWPSEELGEEHCYSGCCAVRADGTPVILYTSIGPHNGREKAEQWAAVGDAALTCWTKHPGNPVMAQPIHGDQRMDDWRDPCVFREGGQWYAVVGGHPADGTGSIALYRSPDLLAWEFIGLPVSGDERNWECPNLHRLGDRWLLYYSPHDPVRWMVGDLDLDACRFTVERTGAMDGPRFYAPTGLATADGRRVCWGWVRGHQPGRGWTGCLSLPRVLSLLPDGTLGQAPAVELAALRTDRESFAERTVSSSERLGTLRGEALEIRLEVAPPDAITVRLGGAELRWADGALSLGDVRQPLDPAGAPLRLTVYWDHGVVEAFANDRLAVTGVVTPGDRPAASVTLEAAGARLLAADIWRLADILPGG